MDHEPPYEEYLLADYEKLVPKFKKLEESLKRDLKTFLDEAGISVLSIESRVKELPSFWSKMQRQHYAHPLKEMPDICGLRVICYYPSDLEPVCKLVRDKFEVIDYEDKADSLKPEQFGYRSRHFVVTPDENALGTASYQGLEERRAEIQVRTIFEHAWAELSHDLDYKKEEHAPKEFRRTIHQLGAMLENLDAQFDELHTAKVDYRRSVSQEAARGELRVDQELNIDSLQALLDVYFAERERNPEDASVLLAELRYLGLSLSELVEAIERVKDELPLVESERTGLLPRVPSWSQPSLLREALSISHDRYWEYVRFGWPDRIGRLYAKWRASLSNSPDGQTGRTDGETT